MNNSYPACRDVTESASRINNYIIRGCVCGAVKNYLQHTSVISKVISAALINFLPSNATYLVLGLYLCR